MHAIIHNNSGLNTMKKLGVAIFAVFVCFTHITVSANTKAKETQMVNEFNLPIQNEHRNIRLRFARPAKKSKNLPQLIIIATGLYSQIDKASQVKLAEDFQNAGFATLQFNFMAHGDKKNKSDGNIEDVTISSGIQDLKAVWDYAKNNLSQKVNTNDIAIAANSYGALVSLIALENNIISPESMVLTAPFSLDTAKRWLLPLRILAKLAPHKVSTILKMPPTSPKMLQDFFNNHTNAMTKKDLLGDTAVYFFIGAADKVSSCSDIKKWCKKFNSNQPANVPFVDNIQAHYKIYEDVPHFKIPDNVGQDIRKRSIEFIKKTHMIKTR